jgi:TetR/AcrR family transcriptional regulator, hemagglutinin/protease regulatory protein
VSGKTSSRKRTGKRVAPRRGATRQRAARMRPDERRAQLLACALAAFAEHGIAGARHADVAAAAQVALPTVFFYFPTREALVEAVVAEVARFFLEQMQQALSVAGKPAQRLLRNARQFVRLAAEHPDYMRVWLDWSTAMREELWPQYLALQARAVAMLAEVLREGQRDGSVRRDLDAEDSARVFVGAAYVVVQMQLTESSAESIDRFVRNVVRATTEPA